ncbi:MAG: ferritin-like domain-containing protein [Litorimonas sp.]
MSGTTKSLKDLYIHEIKDIHSANKQAAETCGMFARKLPEGSPLIAKFEQSEQMIKDNNAELEKLAERHGETASGMHCKGMEGLVTEAKKHVLHSDYTDEALREATAIAQFQRMTHYAISGYGTANAYAKQLGDDQGSKTFQGLLDEGYEGDRAFTDMAVNCINEQAAHASEEEE